MSIERYTELVVAVSERSDKNWPVQSQKKARSLKKLEILDIHVSIRGIVPCSKNKGTDQLCIYCCFVFSSPVRKYRKSYCNHPGVGVSVSVGVSVGVAQNVKVFG